MGRRHLRSFFAAALIFLFISPLLNCYGEETVVKEWTRQLGTPDLDSGTMVVIDGSGYVYIYGHTEGSMEGYTNAGGADGFIAKYDNLGNRVWIVQFGSSGAEYSAVSTLAIDKNGLITAGGGTAGNFDGETNIGGYDMFLTQYDSLKNHKWTRIRGTEGKDVGSGITTDENGNVYITGETSGNLDGHINAGSSDAFLVKYDSQGTYQWTQQWGTPDADGGHAVAVDRSGNIYVAGRTTGAFPGYTNAGGYDIFLTKLDSSGKIEWTQQWGTPGFMDEPISIATDDDGNIYVAGDTGGSLDGNTYFGGQDIFLSKFDASSGDRLWTRQRGTYGTDIAGGIALDKHGNIYLSGYTNGRLDGQPSAGWFDAFLMKFDTQGNHKWTHQWGTGAIDYGWGVAVDNSQDIYVYVGGVTYGSMDGINAGNSDVFLTKFKIISDAGKAPVANAGPDQTVDERTLVTLDGSGSTNPGGAPLTYSWTQIAGTNVTLNLGDAVHPTFIAPGVPAGGGTLTFQLTVSNGNATSGVDIVNIFVKNVNHPPVADAGGNQTVKEGSPVTLSGEYSYDLDGEPLTFTWSQISGQSVVLADPNQMKISFLAPQVGPAGENLFFKITVSDGIDEASDIANIFVENVNHPPLANAGKDQTVNEKSQVTLNGAGSSDPDGDLLTFSWAQVSGPAVTLLNSSTPTPTFIAPYVSPQGATLIFRLTVNDGLGGMANAYTTVWVKNVDDPPSCNLARAEPALLWPPNHKMEPIKIVNLTDPNNDQVTLTITGVSQDEPINGLGDGDTSPDAVIDQGNVFLRAERSGKGNGRVYQINFRAEDSFGESCTGSVMVCVPHDRKDGACGNDGQFYNSTIE